MKLAFMRYVRDVEAVGSNPITPTMFLRLLAHSWRTMLEFGI